MNALIVALWAISGVAVLITLASVDVKTAARDIIRGIRDAPAGVRELWDHLMRPRRKPAKTEEDQ